MTGVAHLATALLLKGKVREAPLRLLLVAAAAPDLLWVLLNLVSLPGRPAHEITRPAVPFSALADLNIIAQPWSHSLGANLVMALLGAALTWLVLRRRRVAAAVFAAIVGHLLLDYLVHHADLPLTPAATSFLIGPAFPLDLDQPERGLVGTAPWLAFALQTAVVVISAVVFLRSFPAHGPGGRRLFLVGTGALTLLALPIYLGGPITRWIGSMPAFPICTAIELVVIGLLLDTFARRSCGRFFPAGPFDRGPNEAVTFVRRLFLLAAALSFTAALLHLAEGMISARQTPTLAVAATLLALFWAELGRRFVTGNPATVWGALGVATLASPLARLWLPSGRLLLPTLLVELATAALCLFLLRTLLRRDLLL